MTNARPQLPRDLQIYGLMTGLLAGFLPGILQRRAAKGKEDRARLGERLGTASITRPEGTLVWLHGASVGESMVALSVAQHMRAQAPNLQFLFTSGTKTSANLIASRLHSADRHSYVPVDTQRATTAFIAGWAPDLAIFIEGEIWPNLIIAARKAGISTALINARMTTKSVANWARHKAAAHYLFDGFDLVLPADERTKLSLSRLRSKEIGEAGNLKLESSPPQVDKEILGALRAAIGDRPVWLAASTHAGEEKSLILAHNALTMGAPDALMILAPRHPERANDVEVDCRIAGFVPMRRSKGQVPAAHDPIWLWDTMGELGLAMSLASVTLMGGSFVGSVGGHNPVEPAQLGSAIISGALVHNFEGLYHELEEHGGARILDDPSPDRIAVCVAGLLGNEDQRGKEVQAAREVISRGAGAMAATVKRLLELLQ